MHRRPYHIIAGSILVATLFWLSVTLSESYVARFTIPLSIVNLPGDVALGNPLPEEIEVALQGTGWQLLFLSASNQLLFEIPGNRIHGDKTILTNRIISEAMKLPPGILAIQTYPETLFINVDEYIEKKVAVKLVLGSIRFRENYGLTGAIRVEPDSVIISGAEKVMASITEWPTSMRTFTDLSEPVLEDIALSDSLRGVVRHYRDAVKLYIPVDQLADMSFPEIPVKVSNVPRNKTVLLANSSVEIFVRSGVNTLSTITADSFQATIPYTTILNDTTGAIIPAIHLPSGTTLLKIHPPAIRYTIRQGTQ